MSPERLDLLNQLLLKSKTGLTEAELLELQQLFAEYALSHPNQPPTSATISEATMSQLVDGFLDTQAVVEEIKAQVKADSLKRQAIIDKSLQIHAAIAAAKALKPQIDKHLPAIDKSLNPSPKPGDSLETILPQAAQAITTPVTEVLTPGAPLTPIQQANLDQLFALGLIQNQTELLQALAVVAPTDTPLSQLHQEVAAAFEPLTPADQAEFLDTVAATDFSNRTAVASLTANPVSEHGFRVNADKIQAAVADHLAGAETQINTQTAKLEAAQADHPKLADTDSQVTSINNILKGRLANTLTDGTYLEVTKDPVLASVANKIVLQAASDQPTSFRYQPNRGVDQVAALRVTSPTLAEAVRIHSSRVTPDTAARSSRRANLPATQNFRLITNLIHYHQNKNAPETLSTAPANLDAFYNRIAGRLPFGGHTFQLLTHPSRTLGNYFLKQIGTQTGKTFLKGFAQGLVAAEKTTARQLASTLITNVAKLGIKAGLKATATSLISAGGGAAAGGTIGAVGGPLGIIAGIAVGFILDKTIGLLKKGLDSIAIALTGDKVDWKALGAAAVAAPVAGIAAVGAGISLVISAVSLTFLSPLVFAGIIGAYIFFWIPTINIAPLLSTLVHLDSGVGGLGGETVPVGGRLPPIEGLGCVKFDTDGWGKEAWRDTVREVVLYLNQNHSGFMSKVCRGGQSLTITNWRNEPVGYYGFNPQHKPEEEGHIYLRDRLFTSSKLFASVLYTLTHEMAHEVNWRDWSLLRQFEHEVLCQAGGSLCDPYLPTYRWGKSPPEDFAETAAWYVTWIKYKSDRYPLPNYSRHWNFAVTRFFGEG